MTEKIEKFETEWQNELTDFEYRVTREAATEMAFTGEYWDTKTEGTYKCRCCGEPLFSSESKYDSGSGWPSFYAPLNEACVSTKEDNSMFMRRVEALCAKCDAHLGHIFPDGPHPSGLRYCLNSASLKLIPKDE